MVEWEDVPIPLWGLCLRGEGQLGGPNAQSFVDVHASHFELVVGEGESWG